MINGKYMRLGGYYASSTDNKPIEDDAKPNVRFVEGFFRSRATSGDNRALYLRHDFAGTGGGGDCARFYTLAKAAVGTVQGIHATGQIATGGSVTGLINAVRATFATSASLTLNAGTAYSLLLDSDLSTAVNGMTTAAFIGVSDVNGTNKMPFFMHLATDGCLGAGTVSSFTKGGLKVKMPDGTTGYIPIGATLTP